MVETLQHPPRTDGEEGDDDERQQKMAGAPPSRGDTPRPRSDLGGGGKESEDEDHDEDMIIRDLVGIFNEEDEDIIIHDLTTAGAPPASRGDTPRLHSADHYGGGKENENEEDEDIATIRDLMGIRVFQQAGSGDDESEKAGPQFGSTGVGGGDDVIEQDEQHIRSSGSSSNDDDGDEEECGSSTSDDEDSIDIGIFDEGWLRADEALIAEVHWRSAEFERELASRGMDSPFRDASEIIPSFATFHQQMGGYAANRGASPLHSKSCFSNREEEDEQIPDGEHSSNCPDSLPGLDMGFVANHVYCSETSHVPPTCLITAHSSSLSADAMEIAMADFRRDPMKRHREAENVVGDGGGADEAGGNCEEIICRNNNDNDDGDDGRWGNGSGNAAGPARGADVDVDAKGWRGIHRKLDAAAASRRRAEARREKKLDADVRAEARREKRRIKKKKRGSDGSKAGRLLDLFARRGNRSKPSSAAAATGDPAADDDALLGAMEDELKA